MTVGQHTPTPWVRYNLLTDTYDTPDGTRVSAALVDNVKCLADVLYIARIRQQQREAIARGCRERQ